MRPRAGDVPVDEVRLGAPGATARASRAERTRSTATWAESSAEQAESSAEEAESSARQAESQADDAESRAERAIDGAAEARTTAQEAAVTADAAEQAAQAAADAAMGIDADDPLADTATRRIEAQVTEHAPFGRPGPPMSRRSPFRIGLHGALGVAVAYGIVQAISSVRGVLVLLLISAFLAIGLNPVVEFFERRGMRRGLAVTVVLVAVLLVFALFVLAIVPPITQQTGDFINQAPSYLDELRRNATVRSLDKRFHVIEQIQAFVSSPKLAANAFGGVLGVSKVVFSVVFSTITVLTLTLYFMSSLPAMKEGVYRLVPRSRRARVGVLTDDILERVGGYVGGCLVVAACAGTTSYIVLLIAGVPYALALAVVVTLTDLVPVVGATIGAIVVTLVAFTVSVPVGIAVAVWYLAYQQLENFLIYPRVMKRSVDVAPAATVVAVLIGGSLLGIVGALLAIPIAAAIQLVLVQVVQPKQDMS